MKEFHSDANRLPRRLQGRCHVSCGVQSVAFSDVHHRTIVETVPTSALFGTGAYTVRTLLKTVDCSNLSVSQNQLKYAIRRSNKKFSRERLSPEWGEEYHLKQQPLPKPPRR